MSFDKRDNINSSDSDSEVETEEGVFTTSKDNSVVKGIKWYKSAFTSKLLSNASSGTFALASGLNILSKYPMVQFITTPAYGFCNIISHALWMTSIVLDPQADLEKNKDKKNLMSFTDWLYKGSSFSGFIAGAAMVIASSVSAAGPIALLVGTCFMCISNAFWTMGEVVELIRTIKHAPKDDMRWWSIAAQSSRVGYASFGTLSVGLVAAALLAEMVFPPAAGILFIAATATAIISCVGLASSTLINNVINKKRGWVENGVPMHEFETNKNSNNYKNDVDNNHKMNNQQDNKTRPNLPFKPSITFMNELKQQLTERNGKSSSKRNHPRKR